ncbi:hypothetical protein HK101_001407 [Irineochytrium annulatum]|nr:hypothetical protein HK101_001407 [Irineochytrium annulatum]
MSPSTLPPIVSRPRSIDASATHKSTMKKPLRLPAIPTRSWTPSRSARSRMALSPESLRAAAAAAAASPTGGPPSLRRALRLLAGAPNIEKPWRRQLSFDGTPGSAEGAREAIVNFAVEASRGYAPAADGASHPRRRDSGDLGTGGVAGRRPSAVGFSGTALRLPRARRRSSIAAGSLPVARPPSSHTFALTALPADASSAPGKEEGWRAKARRRWRKACGKVRTLVRMSQLFTNVVEIAITAARLRSDRVTTPDLAAGTSNVKGGMKDGKDGKDGTGSRGGGGRGLATATGSGHSALAPQRPLLVANLIGFQLDHYRARRMFVGHISEDMRRVLTRSGIGELPRTARERELLQRLTSTLPAFAKYTPEMRRALSGVVRYGAYAKGRVIVRQGHEALNFYFILSGQVEVQKEIDSENYGLTTLEPGDSFGELALLNDVRRAATIVTTKDAELLWVNKEDFNHVLKTEAARDLREKRAFIKSIPFFNRLPAHAVESLALSAQVRDITPDTVVFAENHQAGYVYILWYGSCDQPGTCRLLKYIPFTEVDLDPKGTRTLLFPHPLDPTVTPLPQDHFGQRRVDRILRIRDAEPGDFFGDVAAIASMGTAQQHVWLGLVKTTPRNRVTPGTRSSRDDLGGSGDIELEPDSAGERDRERETDRAERDLNASLPTPRTNSIFPSSTTTFPSSPTIFPSSPRPSMIPPTSTTSLDSAIPTHPPLPTSFLPSQPHAATGDTLTTAETRETLLRASLSPYSLVSSSRVRCLLIPKVDFARACDEEAARLCGERMGDERRECLDAGVLQERFLKNRDWGRCKRRIVERSRRKI